MTDTSPLLAALSTVRDPELDESVTALGFVSSCALSVDGVADVQLRLPTYFCAPNFAWLMVADAYEAVSAVPGIHQARITLVDHFAAESINEGVAARAGFVDTFGTLAAAELDELRADFVRRAVLAGTHRVCRPLLAAGRSHAELATLRLGDVPPSPDLERLRARRRELGLPAEDDSPLVVDATTGAEVDAKDLPMHLGRSRLSELSAQANSGICRSLLRERYATPGLGEESA